MTRQLAFDLPATVAFRREDFFASPANAEALAAMDGWTGWPGGKLVLVGPQAAGKTHLAHIWAEAAGAALISAQSLLRADLPALARGPVAVENVDEIAGDAAAETALFHLHNLLAGRGLLMTAATAPRDWGLVLADLKSRVQAAGIAQLQAPDDALLSAVLVKLFADRQIAVPPNLIPFLLVRMNRSIAAAGQLVALLDSHALALRRPVTRALAAAVMEPEPPQ